MTRHRRSILVLVHSLLTVFAVAAAQEAPSQDIAGNPARPGEIIIRRTGRVRLVKVSPATQPTAATQSAAKSAADEGLEYTERSVRLPLGYDPAENFYGPGPVLDLSLEAAFSVPY